MTRTIEVLVVWEDVIDRGLVYVEDDKGRLCVRITFPGSQRLNKSCPEHWAIVSILDVSLDMVRTLPLFAITCGENGQLEKLAYLSQMSLQTDQHRGTRTVQVPGVSLRSMRFLTGHCVATAAL